MRIAIDALLVCGAFSGVQHTILHQIRALLACESAHDFLVVALADVPIEEHIGSTHAYRVARAPARSGQRLRRIVWEQASLPGLLAAQGVDLLYSPGYLTSLRWRGPSVVFIHDTIALIHPRLCSVSNAVNYRLLLPPSARRATLVATPSTASARDVAQYCRVSPSRIRVVPNGVHIPPMPTAAQVAAMREKLGVEAPFLLAVSTIEPKKNFANLIRWFDAWKDAGIPHHLVIAGKWGWRSREVRQALAQARYRAQIHLPGYFPQQEITVMMAAADVLLMPSRYEGFGLPALEAMAVGTPVVVSNRGALPETVGTAGVVIPLEEALWRAEIPTLLRFPARLQALRAAGRAHAEAHTWQHSAARLLAVFEEAYGKVKRQK